MKKIYSFMLMATMLLVGANAWAGNVSTAAGLKSAFENASDGDVINVTYGFSVLSQQGQLVLNVDGDVVLQLNGNTIEMTQVFASDNAAILVKQGRLTILNGVISENGTKIYDLIRVNGLDGNAAVDAKTQTPYAQVIVGAGATIESSHANALTICETKGTGAYNYANGARIDILNQGVVIGKKYGIKVNGNVKTPTVREYSPYVYVHSGANVTTSATASEAVAAYSSGYARWRIEGYCGGSTGLYVKAGDVEITGEAKVYSTAPQDAEHAIQTGKSSGVTAGGSAIVMETNKNYEGNMSVTISGSAEVKGTNGYAIEEKIAADAPSGASEVESLSIQGGEIKGGAAGGVIVEDKTKNQVTVVGGDITGNVQAGTTVYAEAEAMYAFLPGDNNSDNAYVVTVTGNATDGYSYKVVPDLSKAVTLNAYGISTFSATEARVCPDGLTAYKAEYSDGKGYISLVALDGYIPANTGVILMGNGSAYTLSGNTTGASAATNLTNNRLQPKTEFANHSANIYVLVGNELYKYTGTEMKDNKAYLDLGTEQSPYGAPQRIRMVIAEEEEVEQTEAVERVEAASVKAVKFVENGEILIRRGENVYNLQGQIVK